MITNRKDIADLVRQMGCEPIDELVSELRRLRADQCDIDYLDECVEQLLLWMLERLLPVG